MSDADRIVRLLEKNTSAGHRLSSVFDDWLDLAHNSLASIPRHFASAVNEGKFAQETPEEAALFARLRAKYTHNSYWDNFGQAFGILLRNTEGFWDPKMAHPEALRLRSARRSLHAHVRQRARRPVLHPLVSRRHDGPNDHRRRLRPSHPGPQGRPCQSHHERRRRLHHTCLKWRSCFVLGEAVPALPDQDEDYLAYGDNYVFPLLRPFADPITICDPCVGSGVMLLTAARRFPQWAFRHGFVQLYGVDIDATCVKLCQANLMLYGLTGGFTAENALTAPAKVIESLPEPFVAAYQLAREADQAGQPEIVEEIAATLRLQQALFDPDEFVVQLQTPKTQAPATGRSTRPTKADRRPTTTQQAETLCSRAPHFSRTNMPPCKHPPTRIYTWFAYDGTLCAGCCDCGEVLAGAADDTEPGGEKLRRSRSTHTSRPPHQRHGRRTLSRPGKRHNHKPRRKKE